MSYNVKLDVFEGPLDLLLHLIKVNEVDLYDIPIATITEQYFEYIELIKNLNLELAGEFLLMAATLTHLKSKLLLPPEETDNDEDDELDGVDPRDELVRKLVEYKQFKEAAFRLRGREADQRQVFTRIPSDTDLPDAGDLLVEVSVFELLRAFKGILERLGEKGKTFSLSLEEISVTDRINAILEALETVDHITFDALFGDVKTRMELIATFLGLLEVTRLKLVRAHQTRPGGEILIYRTEQRRDDTYASEFDELEKPAESDETDEDDLADHPAPVDAAENNTDQTVDQTERGK